MARAKKTKVGKRVFDSKTEADYYSELLSQQKEGLISKLKCQVEFNLMDSFVLRDRTVRGMIYTPDFTFVDRDGILNVVEVKGYSRPEYLMRRKIFLKMYGDEHIFHEVKRSGKKWKVKTW